MLLQSVASWLQMWREPVRATLAQACSAYPKPYSKEEGYWVEALGSSTGFQTGWFPEVWGSGVWREELGILCRTDTSAGCWDFPRQAGSFSVDLGWGSWLQGPSWDLECSDPLFLYTVPCLPVGTSWAVTLVCVTVPWFTGWIEVLHRSLSCICPAALTHGDTFSTIVSLLGVLTRAQLRVQSLGWFFPCVQVRPPPPRAGPPQCWNSPTRGILCRSPS